MNLWWNTVALAVVVVSILGVGYWGMRSSRTTSDFYVAGRGVRARVNATAITGEFISTASFLGVAGMIASRGSTWLWAPVALTTGFVCLSTLVAAPLRRSGAYTLPDFAEARLGGAWPRVVTSVAVVLLSGIYLCTLLSAAGMVFDILVGWPPVAGMWTVTAVVLVGVLAGGMRSATTVQAMQYWLKLGALVVPALVLGAAVVVRGRGIDWSWDPAVCPAAAQGVPDPDMEAAMPGSDAYRGVSLMVGVALGTVGMPHVLHRFYTNPDGRAARATSVGVVGLLGLFFLFPSVYAVLAHERGLAAQDWPSVVLALPSVAVGGPLGAALTAVLALGTFAAAVSTVSGLSVCVGTVLDQDVIRPWQRHRSARRGGARTARISGGVRVRSTAAAGRPEPTSKTSSGSWTLGPPRARLEEDLERRRRRLGFRVAATVGTLVPTVVASCLTGVDLPTASTVIFDLAAATFAPLLILGIWWTGLSRRGAVVGVVFGAVTALAAPLAGSALPGSPSWPALLLHMPSAWLVPLTFAVMYVVSRADPDDVPEGVAGIVARLHLPEASTGETRWVASRSSQDSTV